MIRLFILATTAAACAASAPGSAQSLPGDPAAIAAQAEAAAIAAERDLAIAQANSAAAAATARAAAYAKRPPPPSAAVTGVKPAAFDLVAVGAASATTRLEKSVANGPNDRLLNAGAIPDAQLLVSQDDAIVSLTLSIDNGGEFIGDEIVTNAVSLRAFGNLKDGKSRIVGLGGFSNGAGLGVTFTRFVTPASLAALSNFTRADVDNVLAACTADAAIKDKALCTTNNADNGGIGAMMAKYDPDGFQRQLDRMITGDTRFYGVNFQGSHTTAEYLDRSAFALAEDTNFGFTGSVFGGLIDRRGNWSLTGFAEYNRTFKANSSVTLCQTIAGTAQTQCLTGADAAPKRRTELLLGAEWRQQFRLNAGSAPIAIAPRLAYDARSTDFSVDFPIYLASEGPGKLRGGLLGAFRNQKQDDGTRKDSFALSLFFGVPFSVFPNAPN